MWKPLIVLLGSMMLIANARTQGNPAFEVVSIKVSADTSSGGPRTPPSPSRYARTNASLRDLIGDAYNLQPFEIINLPAADVGAARFDVIATASLTPSPEQMRQMMQRLLVDRFGLQAHREKRELPVYVLRPVRNDRSLGPRMKQTAVDCVTIRAERQNGGASAAAKDPLLCRAVQTGMPGPAGITVRYRASGITTRELSAWLARYVGRTVINRTQLVGDFDIDVSFTPEQSGAAASSAGDPVLIFTAVQEQLGLKLESGREVVEVLVVDSAKMPTPN